MLTVRQDEFTRLTGGTATVFRGVGDDFLRVTTSLKIQAMFERLQGNTRQAATAMRNGRDRAGNSLWQIRNSVPTITRMIMQIVAAAEEQTAVAEDINRRVVVIGDVDNQNAGAVDEISRSMR